jgi:hypothetical membrane protein
MGVAAVTVIAPAAFWTAVATGSVLRPGYDQAASTISRLSVGPNAAVMDAGFIAYGLLTIAIALVLSTRVAPGLGRSALLLLGLSGACTASLGIQWVVWTLGGAVLVPARPGLTTDPAYDLIHDALAAGAFTFSGVGSLLTGMSVRGRPGWAGYPAFFFAVSAVVLVLSTYLALRFPGAQGAVQRVAVVALQSWVAVLAFRLPHTAVVPPIGATAR